MLLITKKRALQKKTINKENNNDLHFINLVRFISMIGIVSIHCLIIPADVKLNDFINASTHDYLYILCLNLLRFSVISFCLISGYLIGPKLETERFTYYVRRLRVTVPPFVVALSITAAFMYAITAVSRNPFQLLPLVKSLFTDSPFWFIPSQLISLLLLVLLLHTIKSRYVGLFLFSIVLFLTIQFVYLQTVAHTDLIFSFVFAFYYWLGIIIRKLNWISSIKKMNMVVLLVAWMLSYFLLNFETIHLLGNNHPNILNNLKFSNQVYSIVSFILIVRISKHIPISSVFNPRTETLGIYLFHWLFRWIVMIAMGKLINPGPMGLVESVFYSVLCFVLTYSITTIVVKVIGDYKIFYLQTGRNKTRHGQNVFVPTFTMKKYRATPAGKLLKHYFVSQKARC